MQVDWGRESLVVPPPKLQLVPPWGIGKAPLAAVDRRVVGGLVVNHGDHLCAVNPDFRIAVGSVVMPLNAKPLVGMDRFTGRAHTHFTRAPMIIQA